MHTYETADSSGEFSYELTYAPDGPGFAMQSLRVQRDGQTVFSKQQVGSFYANEALLQATGIRLCEAVINHLRKA